MRLTESAVGRAISFLVAFIIFGTAIVPEASYAATATILAPETVEQEGAETLQTDPSSEGRCARLGNCVTMTSAGSAPVLLPQLSWTTRGTLSAGEARALVEDLLNPLDMTIHSQVPDVMLANYRSLRMAQDPQIRQTAVANVLRENAGPPTIFGTYVSSDGTLHIEAVRSVRSLNGGIEIQSVDITPYDFDMFKATQAFTTEAEQRAGQQGRNPFDFAKSAAEEDDYIFRNISFEAAQVAMGMAMRSTGAIYGVMTTTKDTWKTWTKKKKSLLSTTIEYHTAADIESVYHVMTPLTTQGGGDNPTFCADDPERKDCPAELLASAGVSSTQWLGGTFEQVKQKKVYHHMWKQTDSFNWVAAIIIVAAIVLTSGFIGAALTSTGVGTILGGGVAAGQGMVAAGAAMNASLLGAAVGAGSVVSAAGAISAGALAAGVAQGVAISAVTWAPSLGKHPGATDNHVKSLNDGKRRGKTKYLKVPKGGLRQEARKNVREVAATEETMVPAGAVTMFKQRGNMKPEMHAERLLDFELSQ